MTSPTWTATESIVSGTGSTRGARRGVSRASTKPARSAPASAATATSSSRVRPQTLTSGREISSGQLDGRVGRAHQRRADEDRVRAGELRLRALGARGDAALGDDDPVARRALDEGQLRLPVDLERGEVAGVDPDDVRAELDRALELRRVVRLDQRIEAELGRCGEQPAHALVVEVAQEQQHGVRAEPPQLLELRALGEEALGEQGQVSGGSRRKEIRRRSPEAFVYQDGDRGRFLALEFPQ